MVLRSFLSQNIIFWSYWRLKKRPILKLINRPYYPKGKAARKCSRSAPHRGAEGSCAVTFWPAGWFGSQERPARSPYQGDLLVPPEGVAAADQRRDGRTLCGHTNATEVQQTHRVGMLLLRRSHPSAPRERSKQAARVTNWSLLPGPPPAGSQVLLQTNRIDGLYRTYLRKKSRWQRGGLRDSALYFGFSLISKMASWRLTTNWFSFVYFLIQPPQKGDLLNKFYTGPPGLVNFWGFKSRLFCLTGVQLMRTWLTQLTQNHCYDGRLLEIQIRLDLRNICDLDNSLAAPQPKAQLFRRLKYIRLLRHIQINPASMILSVLPVLPPDLRPILQLDRHLIAVSDLNKLYQTVLLRNRRLSRLTRDQNFHCLNSEALQYAQRLLQESVDSLIDNGKVSTRRPLKSLSDLFKGKKGRFRQNLLGKRVDYSGRSVIVVGPYLKIYECGLPKDMAYELFQPFLLRMLMFQNQAQTILGAKKIFNEKSKQIWSLLKEIVQSHPVLLNRAPTLHRLSIQAFQPRLIEGKAILLHPLVCAAFNADFDGDQMGVHIPLCFESRAEAWKITWSQNNLFSVATGLPVRSPSQDMILGSSFLTTQNTQKFSFLKLKKILNKKIPNFSMNLLFEKKPIFFNRLHQSLFLMEKSEFTTFPEIKLISFSRKSLSENRAVWCSYNPICNGFETEKKRQKLIEIRLNLRGEFQKFRSQFYQQYHSSDAEILRKIRTTYGRVKFYESLLIY